ncbi:MAG: DUF488 family protein [Euryarchaeota archaeon]|nr:DUF488 family protein [Euryarchaeota archaeon]
MKLLTHKQRILLKVVERLSEKENSSRFMLVKTLFLLAHEENIRSIIKFYNFFPYKYGPFSNVCYADLYKLEQAGLLAEDRTRLTPTEAGIKAATSADHRASMKIKRVTSRFNSNREIKDYVYRNYQEYTVKSEIVPTTDIRSPPALFTIGYEGRDIDSFLNVLIQNQIDLLIDVRKNPFSMNFSFTRSKLENYLGKVDIRYTHIPELGIDSGSRKNLVTRRDYQRLFKRYEATTLKEHSKEVKRIIGLGEDHRAALLCFEADINLCHRGVIARDIEMQQNKGVIHL